MASVVGSAAATILAPAFANSYFFSSSLRLQGYGVKREPITWNGSDIELTEQVIERNRFFL